MIVKVAKPVIMGSRHATIGVVVPRQGGFERHFGKLPRRAESYTMQGYQHAAQANDSRQTGPEAQNAFGSGSCSSRGFPASKRFLTLERHHGR